ncbi:MAG: protein kinase [Acidimicrobiales bacterium]
MRSIADYELLEQLQPGNHGTFYIARPPARLGLAHDRVAVKILDRNATDNEFKRMAAELEILLELNHPRLVEVLDAGHNGGRLYYVTRYYDEGSLPLGPCRDLRQVLLQVADAAEAAHVLHENGVAHRDIKPSNILLADGRGHLSDLGVANYTDANFTTTGSSPVGTLAYADPKLIHGEPPGRASDVWSLGATLHAAVTGQSVLGDIPNANLATAIEYVLGAAARVAPSCPPEVAAVIRKATATERVDRHLTADELAADLRELAQRQSDSPPGPGSPPPPPGSGARAVPPPPPPPRSAPVRRVPGTSEPLLVSRSDRPPPPTAPYQQPVVVDGVVSVAGQLNHPLADRCWASGEIRGSAGPWVPQRGHRPPLGVFIFDDGRSYVLAWDTVLGRQPDTDLRVSEGRAAPLALEGELTMSRAHLAIELRDWDVFVTDLSANGTRLRRRGSPSPERLVRGQPTPLSDGDELLIAKRTVTYRSHHRAGH